MKLLLKIKYVGSNYAGYQVQNNARTIQGELTKAVSDLFGMRCDVTGCSRTDAGVHAKLFCATVQEHSKPYLHTNIPCEKIPHALNVRLPDDIAVFSAEPVSEDFHARYSVLRKTYEYRILTSAHRDPFLINKVYHYSKCIGDNELRLMKDAALKICGKHDFTTFMASGSKVTDCVRTVYDCSVERDGDEIVVRITADGFLYNMVRIICGTLIDVAKGNISPDKIHDIIVSKDRKNAGATLPACGLYLVDVEYN